jgi:hypothetical protein
MRKGMAASVGRSGCPSAWLILKTGGQMSMKFSIGVTLPDATPKQYVLISYNQ